MSWPGPPACTRSEATGVPVLFRGPRSALDRAKDRQRIGSKTARPGRSRRGRSPRTFLAGFVPDVVAGILVPFQDCCE